MKKKLLAFLLCVVMVATVVCVLAACDKDGDYDYEITVWVGEGMQDLTAQQIKTFNETNEFGIKFKATIEIQSEKASIGNMEGKPASSWPDIFCFAQDQLARAVKGKMLQKLSGTIVSGIEANSTEDAVNAAKIGDTVCAFPMTADNGYFMYYDKRVVKEDHIGSLEDIIADVSSYTGEDGKGRNFSMNLTKAGGGWYAASFFYATGCKSEWKTGELGNFEDFDDTFKSDNGVIALQGMQKLLKATSIHQDSDSTADFNAAIPSAVVISGIWDYNTASKALGSNLGIAKLPKFTVGEKSYQLQSYLGHKFMGIKPQSDGHKAAYLQQLAAYLTNAECQKARFELSGWGPSDKSLTLTSPALTALKETATVMQGQYPDSWWSDVLLMTGSAKTATSDAETLMGLLDTYNKGLSNYIK